MRADARTAPRSPVVFDPHEREAQLRQRTERIIAAFRIMGGSVGVLLTLLARADHPPLELSVELVLMGGYTIVGVVVLLALRTPRDLATLRVWGRRLLLVDALVLLTQPPLHAYTAVPQGPSPALVLPFLAGLRGSFAIAWAGVGGVAVAFLAQDLLATRIHGLPSAYDPAVVTVALAAVLGVVTAYLAQTAEHGRRMADAATAETIAMHRVLRAGVGGGVDAVAPRMTAELEALLGSDRVRLDLVAPAEDDRTGLPLVAGGRTLGVLRVDPDVDVRRHSLERLADQAALALQAAMVLDREVDLTRRYHDLHRLQADFVALASHELRTPVMAIVGAAEMLLHRGDQLDASDHMELRNAILRQGHRMQRLIDDLLVVGRHDAGSLLVDAVPVHVRELVHVVTAQLREDEVASVGPDDVWVLADRARLEQVVSNLLDNAREHARPPVTVRWERHDDRVHVEVLDHGDGVALPDRDRIFERFVQAGRIDSHSRGSGLGLAIARDLVQAMGGDLWVGDRDDDAVGARFVVSLPAAAVPAPVPAAP